MRNKAVGIALSISAAFLLGCGFLADDTAGDGGAPNSGGGSSSGGGNQEAKASTGKLNQPIRDDKFEFTVTKLKCGEKKVGANGLYDQAQGEFCVVSVTVKNVGKEAEPFDWPLQEAFDAKGTQYATDNQAAGFANPDGAAYDNINPGNQVKFKLVYDVPKGTKLTKIELHDSPDSGGVTVPLA